MDSVARSADQLFPSVGAALFRRLAHLLGDGLAARAATEELFVRFVAYARPPSREPRARWAWIYRVATVHALRLLGDRPPAGLTIAGPATTPSGSSSGSGPEPVRAALPARRDLDEATRVIVVLATVDGLEPDEIAEVVELPSKVVRRRLGSHGKAGSGAAGIAEHPSLLALDRDRAMHAPHLAACPACRAAVGEADRLLELFGREIAPLAAARAAAMARRERARVSGPGWRRALWLAGGLVLVSALALLVARPRAVDRAETPYAGLKGASRAQASGVQIEVARAAEVWPLAPGTLLRSGDRLHFRVRGERPRFLELRVRSGADDLRVFPSADTRAALVRPGQALASEYAVGGRDERSTRDASVWIVGRFADRQFAVDRPTTPDTEVVVVRAERGD